MNQAGENNANFRWPLEKLQAEALKYSTRTEFQNKSKGAYLAAFRRKLLDQICEHMKSPYKEWTEENLLQIALLYSSRSEFAYKNYAAYQAVKLRGLLDTVCSHMKYKRRPAYSFDECKEEALKYETRSEFQKNSKAYARALQMKWLEEICQHMKLSIKVSNAEQNLYNIIKEKYPKAQKFIDNKVRIENKPHIQGFDIDIYISDLHKGIEFDGKYWHSVEGLKRSRSHWPEEDLKNYHQIKDEYFLSKGIKILHIKEETWVNDQTYCIEQCLEFLSK